MATPPFRRLYMETPKNVPSSSTATKVCGMSPARATSPRTLQTVVTPGLGPAWSARTESRDRESTVIAGLSSAIVSLRRLALRPHLVAMSSDARRMHLTMPSTAATGAPHVVSIAAADEYAAKARG
eukprot:Amastigsp_a519338_6.p5 type:complete len:126 gc:universal Amastigsp_a519338_6:178-555(+)